MQETKRRYRSRTLHSISIVDCAHPTHVARQGTAITAVHINSSSHQGSLLDQRCYSEPNITKAKQKRSTHHQCRTADDVPTPRVAPFIDSLVNRAEFTFIIMMDSHSACYMVQGLKVISSQSRRGPSQTAATLSLS